MKIFVSFNQFQDSKVRTKWTVRRLFEAIGDIIFRDDDGKLRMKEIREIYKDILAEYPNCGGFERNVDKFMAEVKRIVRTFSSISL